ncbi:MAG: hypothetical protein QOF78_2672 [Phycisphaerales bacterium]|nr:hypothetical protein [Phycisphaerales bacterium]
MGTTRLSHILKNPPPGVNVRVEGEAAHIKLKTGVLLMEIVYDGRGRNLRLRDQFSFYTIPADDVRSIEVVTLKKRHVLDIRTPLGRLRFFARRDREKLQFLADALKQLIEPPGPAERASENDDVVAVATHSYGALRYWLPRIGIALAAILLMWGVWEGVPAWRSRAWPAAAGEVTHSKWEMTRNSRRDRHYVAEIKYRYRVDGVEHTGERIGFGRFNESHAVRDLLRAHPGGSTIDVFYNPRRPTECTVMRGGGPMAVLPWVCSALTLALCVPGLFRPPTAEQEALVAKYITQPPASPAHAFDDALATVRWTGAIEHAKQFRRAAIRELARMFARVALLTLTIAFGLRYAMLDAAPPQVWAHIFAIAVGGPMLMFGYLCTALMCIKVRPPSYAITPNGILRGSSEHPLLRWKLFDNFDVTDQGGLPLLQLYRKSRKARDVILPPNRELRERVIDAIAAHLPRRPSTSNVTVLPARGFFRRILRRALQRLRR